MKVVLNKMVAIIDGSVVKLVPTGSEMQPSHLGATSIVFNTSADPAPSEFWEQAGKGARYTVTIDKEGA
jgi:hypothetical protein